MSYILDALRRADTERGRGVVPGIHSQMDGPGTAQAAPSRNRTLVWAVAGLSAALVLVIAWMLLRGGETPAPVVAAAPVPAEVPPPVAPPPPAPPPEPAPATIVPTTPPPVIAEAPRTPPREEAPPPRRQRAEQAPAAQPQPAARPSTPVAPSPTAPAPKASPAAAGNTRIYALNELPQDIRGSLPQLSIGGAMYSPNPASRMLIVNGQLMHEGDKITPELVLDQIELKRAVLSFRGYRYSIYY